MKSFLILQSFKLIFRTEMLESQESIVKTIEQFTNSQIHDLYKSYTPEKLGIIFCAPLVGEEVICFMWPSP